MAERNIDSKAAAAINSMVAAAINSLVEAAPLISSRHDFENDAEALSYAERTIAQLRKENAYDDPAMTMVVQNAMRQIIWSIPFLPGYG